MRGRITPFSEFRVYSCAVARNKNTFELRAASLSGDTRSTDMRASWSLREPLPLLYLASANNRSCNLRRHVVVQAANATSKVTPLLQSNILYKHGRRWLRPTPGARPPSVLLPWHQNPPPRLYALVMKCFLTWNCLSRRDRRRHARLSTENNLCSRLRARMSPSFLAIFSHLGRTEGNNLAWRISSWIPPPDIHFSPYLMLHPVSQLSCMKRNAWHMSIPNDCQESKWREIFLWKEK